MCEHNFVNLVEGTTIRGEHLHVYQCTSCDAFDYSVEAWEKDNEGPDNY
jgi:hypothetical protein